MGLVRTARRGLAPEPSRLVVSWSTITDRNHYLLEVCELELLPTRHPNWPGADSYSMMDAAVVTILKGVYTDENGAYDNQVEKWLVTERLFSKDSIALLSPDEKGLERSEERRGGKEG